MVLNIVKNDLPASRIEEYVRCVFDNAKVNIKDENAVSVDIEVTGKNELHSCLLYTSPSPRDRG